jgi:hypothetical protein
MSRIIFATVLLATSALAFSAPTAVAQTPGSADEPDAVAVMSSDSSGPGER